MCGTAEPGGPYLLEEKLGCFSERHSVMEDEEELGRER